ncbi:patatin-like phospholipase family protein [Labrys wisconsinensis]|uniref:NTE family protein n=1 Tax=Labrys wisconsinensis TaxID=425677 RepID=A0ABU0J8R4_9HYPH|nr:patatin-like phospholipase family protein [Labrys wisconsinensis]MDQ0470667.1 NTE family protein [Labrys wisconsinensis]
MLERNPQKAARATLEEISALYDRVALVFQGGGALGAYQAGVYQALADAGCEPTWLSGVSIGAVNASIIAGNEPRHRLHRLEQFWQKISGRKIWAYTPEGDMFRDIRNRTSSWMTMTQGQPGFFKPRFPNPWLQPQGAEGATSFYDSAELKETLEEVIDFDVLNDGNKRLSVGAVNVRTGNFVYFDTDNVRIGPEHIMASGALPPALPAVRIEGEYYWDGGIVSNTPLQYLLDQEEERSSLVFQVDLFSARGTLPRSMPEVLSRHKDIMYSSRTRQNTTNFERLRGLKLHLLDALKRLPKDLLTKEEEALIQDYSKAGFVNIVHLIYQHKNYEGHAKDYEFSGTSMREHWEAGLEDTQRTLRHRQWLVPPAGASGVAVHDLHREDPT